MFAAEQLNKMRDKGNGKKNLICISRGKSLQKVSSKDRGGQGAFLQTKEPFPQSA